MERNQQASTKAGQFCNNITLGSFNQIQSYGVLLVLNYELCVIQCSENTSALLKISHSQLLNEPISNYLKTEDPGEDVRVWLKNADNAYKRMHWQLPQGRLPISVLIHQTSAGVVIEIEPIIEKQVKDDALFPMIQHLAANLKVSNSYNDIQMLIQRACQEIQELTQFDRIIIYQFDKIDHSGVVVGEVLQPEMQSYLGLRFPATDIPKPVRDMYAELQVRYIPTVHEEPIKIIPEINPITKSPLDMSKTNLQMVAPVHVQYMTNMDISASTSIAILHNKTLWGLIACHHKTPKYISADMRLILTIRGNLLASQIASLESHHDLYQQQEMLAVQDKITEELIHKTSLVSALECYYEKLMELVSAQGMSIKLGNNLLQYGNTPTETQVRDLIDWLKTQRASEVYLTAALPLEYKESIQYKEKACGILAIKITAFQDQYLIFYRPEFIQEVAWAGNPDRSLKCTETSYSPRDSFQRFLQIIENHSEPWLNHEIVAANFVHSMIVNKQLQDLLQTQATHDSLTGLLNRLYLEQSLTMELQRAAREKHSVAIILIDLDFFKKINDRFGHPGGDLLLKKFAELLQKKFRGYDHIYRYGGEEFLLILPGVDAETAKEKADFLRESLKALTVTFEGKTMPPITVSMGIAIYPDSGSDAGSLISLADSSLYQAKATGRDRVVLSGS